MIRIPIVLALLASLATGDDPYCPAYPKPQRQIYSARLEVERTAQAMSTNLVRSVLMWSGPRNVIPPGNNIIDDEIFRKMSVASIEPAPLTSDVEILRRLSLDLTGRIPSEARVRSFVADAGANKRARLIDKLMSSEAFVDNWTSFLRTTSRSPASTTISSAYRDGISSTTTFAILWRGTGPIRKS